MNRAFSRSWTLIVLSTLALCSQNCRKNGFVQPSNVPNLVLQAKDYFTTNVLAKPAQLAADNPRNVRTGSPKMPEWEKAAVVSFRNRKAVQVPVQYKNSLAITTASSGKYQLRPETQAKLLLYQDSSKAWHAEMVTLLPDTNYIQKGGRGRFSGIVLVDDWWGNPLKKYRYNPDGSTWIYTCANTAQSRNANVISNAIAPSAFTVCVYLEGYNYSPSDPDGGEHWEELVGCYLLMAPDEGAGGGGGGGGYGPSGDGGGGGISAPPPTKAPSILISPPYLPIADLNAYFKCFTNASGATYQVSLCVDQPEPGTRTPWVWQGDGSSGSIDPVNTGHSFLVITETFPGGWSITRNIGFYPSGNVTPGSDPVPGVFNDDSPHPFNIGGTWTLTSSNFFFMVNYIQSCAGQGYQVNTNNCTNFVLASLGAGHIYLPYTIGGWLGGTGVDPGDLGEDIRAHVYQGMVPFAAGTPHPTVGDCN
ncbi:MAG: hypothetical protein BGO55_08385 [Sphingobacteriales bacterium 50-39]|nr:hypothetical protein [Sphingobacteriales bacterium]OJW59280.1 MAG: hypothetical protein BGO55_08385 [Sphingobacteriales bacterium 50-39]